jgi:transposase
MNKHRIYYSASFKSKVALAALRQEKTISQLSSQFKVHPTLIGKWKSQLIDHSIELFEDGRRKAKSEEPEVDALYQQIGRLQFELEWLKKKSVGFR